MKNLVSKTILGSAILISIFSCNKQETVGNSTIEKNVSEDYTASVSDSISSVATMKVKDKEFIKTADVNMEVKDVYDATISIEKSLKDLGGFVTSSRLNSQTISEETFNTSNENAILVRKFQTENTMQVRVPSEKLGEFLNLINNKKVFLNSRVILAEDVTSNIKLAKLEEKRNAKTAENIDKLKTNKDKVSMIDDNLSEGNLQKISTYEMSDHLKYSTVDIFLKEPKLRIAEIAVTNTGNIDNKYKFNFFYDVRNAFVEGFYLIQRLIVGLVSIWPILVIASLIFYFLRKRKKPLNFEKEHVDE
ncbi:DUF4349 domain-containing protein [Candidatus Kaistella beijingensis]|uniref:DUF4349 domain-containing protein n=1 Tax=Candidatus Kaistella beijingensis TaxID=2820270 RepID=UPI001CC4C806|nr:DUF4349 domain-containing protein [Candidatus Kaistella beijingensis]UBB88855.1 DUF4349 domain-containing protein [Candidatus Kaistella beijingensis]